MLGSNRVIAKDVPTAAISDAQYGLPDKGCAIKGSSPEVLIVLTLCLCGPWKVCINC